MRLKKELAIFLIFLGVGLIVGIVDLAFKAGPSLEYSVSSVPTHERTEESLNFELAENSATFSIKLIDMVGRNDKLRLLKKIGFKRDFPFIEHTNNLTIELLNSSKETSKEYVLYEIEGSLSNLKHASYKVTIVDSHGNLIDQQMINF